MGFDPSKDPEILKLTFRDTSLDGLEVRTRCCTIGEWNELLRKSGNPQRPGPEVADSNEEAIKTFLSYVVSWNLEFKGDPVEPTLENFLTVLSNRQGAQLLAAWQRAQMTVPTSSAEDLNNGSPSAEQLLGMEMSSPDLPNWNPPSS
jgi:hypothetical protein